MLQWIPWLEGEGDHDHRVARELLARLDRLDSAPLKAEELIRDPEEAVAFSPRDRSPKRQRGDQWRPSLALRASTAATAAGMRALRAIEALERIGTPAARVVLKAMAKGEPQARLTREAAASLKRLEGR